MNKMLQALLACAAIALSPSLGAAQETVYNLKVMRVNPPANIFSLMWEFEAGKLVGGGATPDQAFVPDSLASERFLPPALKPAQRAVRLRERLL
ncbi:MAG: hypothetical protein AAB927_00595 [Patescibacteria group bacterium]